MGALASLLMGPLPVLLWTAAATFSARLPADGAYGVGAVFKLTPSGGVWTYTSLYDFTGGSDGQTPRSNLVFDQYGNL